MMGKIPMSKLGKVLKPASRSMSKLNGNEMRKITRRVMNKVKPK